MYTFRVRFANGIDEYQLADKIDAERKAALATELGKPFVLIMDDNVINTNVEGLK